MVRPCFLVIDREHAGSISTRKLVMETAKLNVITAYSAEEGLDTLVMYPAIHGIIVDAGLPGMPCAELVQRLRQLAPGLPIVGIGTPRQRSCPGVDHFLEGFEPTKLMNLLRRLIPGVADVLAREEQTGVSEPAPA